MEDDKSILHRITSPAPLKTLGSKERIRLAQEIRDELLCVISANGGHLAPNLGVVELTIALHTVFNTPEDKIVWDVGHQGYVHKILTGRKEFFKTLRQDSGCCGFLLRDESEYDVFGAGHAGTAISAALGLAAARDRKNGNEKIIAVVGDGSLNCGISLEGLNNVSETTKDLIIVLNDNKMSISRNVGAIAQYLNRMITGKGYNRAKAFLRRLVLKIPGIGEAITKKISRLEEATKSIFVHGVIFEELGIRYIGPIDGHDTEELIRIFEVVKDFDQPVLVHVLTEKGCGYVPATSAPEKFHGLAAFDPDTGLNIDIGKSSTYSSVFGKTMCELASKDESVIAVTAAMTHGTSLMDFSEKFRKRFFDVGIAEEHAVVFAAGLAAGGMKPVVAIYSTFLQRALDCVFHDVCLQKLPVIFACDRAGIVDDGPTHHGIHDTGFLLNLPNISIMAPSSGCELRNMLFAAVAHGTPTVIRYPRAVCEDSDASSPVSEIEWGRARKVREGRDISIWTIGNELGNVLAAVELLKGKGIDAGIVDSRFLKPFDSGLLQSQALDMPIATVEDCNIAGGLGGVIDGVLANIRHKGLLHFGWEDGVVPHGTIQGIRKKFGFTPEKIAERIAEFLGR